MRDFRESAFLWLVIFSFSPVRSTEIKSSQDAVDYLKRFGYIPLNSETTTFRLPAVKNNKANEFKEGISTFQMFAGLKQSGQFDNETQIIMNLPRCGMAERLDIMENKNLNASMLSHKIPRRRKWTASTIFYRIGNFPTSFEIDPSLAREEIRRAFRLWENVANLRCIEIEQKEMKQAEIDILFVSREHGDGNAFGQTSLANVVAHAFFPDHRHFEGDVHFDNERLWTAFNLSGINLFQVAAHEIGHALGLDHSRFPDSVMHMIVKSEMKDNFKLHDDDIKGIQKLYGRRRRSRLTFPGRGRGVGKSRDAGLTFATRTTMVNEQNPDKTQDPQPETNVINVNAVISIPMKGAGNEPEAEPVFQNFWKCFSLSRDNTNSGTEEATKCYKDNVLRLLYSLKLV